MTSPLRLSISLARGSILPAADDRTRVVEGYRTTKTGELRVVFSVDGEVHEQSLKEILNECGAVQRFLNPDLTATAHGPLLSMMPRAKQREALALAQHCIDVLYGHPDNPKDPDNPYRQSRSLSARRKSKQHELKSYPSKMTRMLQAYQADGVEGLVRYGKLHTRSARADQVDPHLFALVQQQVTGDALGSKRDLLNLHAEVLATARARGLVAAAPGVVDRDGNPIPHEIEALSYDTFKRLRRYLMRGHDPERGKTRHQNQNRDPVDGYRHRGFDFGDRVEMDATPVDLFISHEAEVIKVSAVFAICTSTRHLWVRLVPGTPRGFHLALLLWDMITGSPSPDGDDGLGTPPVMPRCVVLDHGAEEENGYFLGLLAQLGITVLWAGIRDPTFKPYVESHIGKFARWCQLLPGHKGNTVENRPQRQPTDLLTFHEVRAVLRSWVHWVARQPISGLPYPHMRNSFVTPMQAVEASLTVGNPIGILSDPTWALRLLPTLSLTPSDDGVTWQKQRYTCPGFEHLIVASTIRTGRREPLTFFYDPDHPCTLYWPEPDTFEVRQLRAPAATGEVTQAFAEVRQALYRTFSSQRWPTHNEWASRRANLIEEMQQTWQRSSLAYDNVIPISRAKTSNADDIIIHNDGWEISDEVLALINDPDMESEEETPW